MDNFANYKNLPLEVQAVLDKHSGDDETYATCQELQDELEQIGWKCEWGLDAVPYFLRKIRKPKSNYRIHKKCGRIKYAGTGIDSWFTLEDAKKDVDYSAGEMIMEYNMKTMEPMWEAL